MSREKSRLECSDTEKRRSLERLAALGLGAATLGLQGTARAGEAGRKLVFAAYGGTFQKALETTVIPMFEKEHGVKVVIVTATASKMLAQIKAQKNNPQVDVMLAADLTHLPTKKSGVSDRLDVKRMKNYADTYEFARDPDAVGVVLGFQSFGIQYNTKVFAEKGWAVPTSWWDLWDPKYKGHLVMPSIAGSYMQTFLGTIAILRGGGTANLEPAWVKFRELVPNVMAFPTTVAQVDSLFASGSAWIGPNSSGRIADLAATGVPVAMAIPKEGASKSWMSINVVKNAPNPQLALAFVDFMIGEAAQYHIATAMRLGPVNRKVKLSAKEAADVPYGPEVLKKLIDVDMEPLEANHGAIVDQINRMIAR
jgi:putative spermidine/putrescine transport system substrate-binding protein